MIDTYAYDGGKDNMVKVEHGYWCKTVDAEKLMLGHMTDAERLQQFAKYCTHCGCDDPKC